MIQAAATAYLLIIAAVIAFQFCLIAGAPWGHLTQGGRCNGALPFSGKVAAGLSVLLLIGMAASIASAAGMPPAWPNWTGWAAVGVQVLSTVLNWITPSAAERRLWGPVTTVMLALAVVTVVGGT